MKSWYICSPQAEKGPAVAQQPQQREEANTHRLHPQHSMTITRMLHAAALLLMQGGFAGAGSERVTLKEGEDMKLHCPLGTPGSDGSAALQWLNPSGFTIFLNAQQGKCENPLGLTVTWVGGATHCPTTRGALTCSPLDRKVTKWHHPKGCSDTGAVVLRDPRYKLIHYSKDELSIQLSNVTVHDEGSYKCFYYSRPFKNKTQTVEILAAPSNPVLEVSQETERGVSLSCYSQGCKPQPHITWLLDNGIELPGDIKHRLGADGKKWNTTSTLTVLSYGPNATATCILRHPALREKQLMASFHFQDLHRTGSKQRTIPPGAPEGPADSSSVPTPAQQSLTADLTSSWPKRTSAASGDEELGSSSSYDDLNGTEIAFKGKITEEALPRTEAPLPHENATVISIFTSEQDPKSKGILKREKNPLLPILVAVLIFVLLIIVTLFMMKLKKAHGVWKRENDVSEQTLESYKSRSNEDSPGQEKNGQVVNQKPNVQYVTKGYGETIQKNPGDKTIAISERKFVCGKEMDV